MQNALLDFLCTALVPELGSDITAGTAGNIHCVLIGISAARAFPDQLFVFIFNDLDLSVITAFLAVVALGIELCVHDRILDMLHDCKDCRNVVLHVRNLNIGNCTAR